MGVLIAIMDTLRPMIDLCISTTKAMIIAMVGTLLPPIASALNAIDYATLPILWVMLIYGRLDLLLAKSVKYTPALPAKEPKYTPADVSVVVPTKEAPAIFLRCLSLWAKNKPKEIIISTVEEELETVKKAIDGDEGLAGLRATGFIKVVYAPKAGKRVQLVEAIKHATGRIVVMTDDHITWSETLLEGVVTCFEDAKVGACGPLMDVDIPEERQDPAIITGWEVGLARMLSKRNAGLRVAHTLGNWCWVIAGPLAAYRTEIVQDGEFLKAFLNDRWVFSSGPQDVGDDTFLSRWTQKHNWTIAIQDVPGTTIRRTARRDSEFITQIFRWERSSVQHYIRTLFGVPQIWRNPYVAWKTIERITRPFFSTVHILAWVFAAQKDPQTVLAFVAFYIYESLPSYWAFFEEYPYMRGHWFAVLATDYCYIIQDLWAWVTVWKTSWEGRKIDKLGAVQEKGVKEVGS